MRSDRAKIVLAYTVCALVWGTTWFAIRVNIAPGGFPTVTAVAMRFALAALLLLPLALRQRGWPRGRTLFWLLLAGALDAAAYLLVYLGEERVSGGVAAVLFGTQPLIFAVLATATRSERISGMDLLGAAVSIVGVGLLFHDRLEVSTSQAIGVALVLAAVFVSTVYSMIMKRHASGVPTLIATTVFILATAATLTIAALLAGEAAPWPPPLRPTLALAYLAVFGSVIAFWSYFWMLQRVRMITASSLVFVFPLVALLADRLWEPMAISSGAYLGVAVTLLGLLVSSVGRARAT
jgi:drug/metabolite transporter (DMT)-like permease